MKSSPEYAPSQATWRRSSYSDASGGNCLEVADSRRNVIPVRDSKNPGPMIAFGATAWGAFVAHL